MLDVRNKLWIKAIAWLIVLTFLPEQVAWAVDYNWRGALNAGMSPVVRAASVAQGSSVLNQSLGSDKVIADGVKEALAQLVDKNATDIRLANDVTVHRTYPLSLTEDKLNELHAWMLDPAHNLFTCGVLSLTGLLSLLGQRISPAQIAHSALLIDILSDSLNIYTYNSAKKLESSLYALDKTAALFGVQLKPFLWSDFDPDNKNITKVLNKLIPFIAFLDDDHMVLVKGLSKTSLVIEDNGKENILNNKEFQRRFSGYGLLLERTDTKDLNIEILSDDVAKAIRGAKSRETVYAYDFSQYFKHPEADLATAGIGMALSFVAGAALGGLGFEAGLKGMMVGTMTSSIGSAATQIAVNNWGWDPTSAQVFGSAIAGAAGGMLTPSSFIPASDGFLVSTFGQAGARFMTDAFVGGLKGAAFGYTNALADRYLVDHGESWLSPFVSVGLSVGTSIGINELLTSPVFGLTTKYQTGSNWFSEKLKAVLGFDTSKIDSKTGLVNSADLGWKDRLIAPLLDAQFQKGTLNNLATTAVETLITQSGLFGKDSFSYSRVLGGMAGAGITGAYFGDPSKTITGSLLGDTVLTGLTSGGLNALGGNYDKDGKNKWGLTATQMAAASWLTTSLGVAAYQSLNFQGEGMNHWYDVWNLSVDKAVDGNGVFVNKPKDFWDASLRNLSLLGNNFLNLGGSNPFTTENQGRYSSWLQDNFIQQTLAMSGLDHFSGRVAMYEKMRDLDLAKQGTAVDKATQEAQEKVQIDQLISRPLGDWFVSYTSSSMHYLAAQNLAALSVGGYDFVFPSKEKFITSALKNVYSSDDKDLAAKIHNMKESDKQAAVDVLLKDMSREGSDKIPMGDKPFGSQGTLSGWLLDKLGLSDSTRQAVINWSMKSVGDEGTLSRFLVNAPVKAVNAIFDKNYGGLIFQYKTDKSLAQTFFSKDSTSPFSFSNVVDSTLQTNGIIQETDQLKGDANDKLNQVKAEYDRLGIKYDSMSVRIPYSHVLDSILAKTGVSAESLKDGSDILVTIPKIQKIDASKNFVGKIGVTSPAAAPAKPDTSSPAVEAAQASIVEQTAKNTAPAAATAPAVAPNEAPAIATPANTDTISAQQITKAPEVAATSNTQKTVGESSGVNREIWSNEKPISEQQGGLQDLLHKQIEQEMVKDPGVAYAGQMSLLDLSLKPITIIDQTVTPANLVFNPSQSQFSFSTENSNSPISIVPEIKSTTLTQKDKITTVQNSGFLQETTTVQTLNSVDRTKVDRLEISQLTSPKVITYEPLDSSSTGFSRNETTGELDMSNARVTTTDKFSLDNPVVSREYIEGGLKTRQIDYTRIDETQGEPKVVPTLSIKTFKYGLTPNEEEIYTSPIFGLSLRAQRVLPTEINVNEPENKSNAYSIKGPKEQGGVLREVNGEFRDFDRVSKDQNGNSQMVLTVRDKEIKGGYVLAGAPASILSPSFSGTFDEQVPLIVKRDDHNQILKDKAGNPILMPANPVTVTVDQSTGPIEIKTDKEDHKTTIAYAEGTYLLSPNTSPTGTVPIIKPQAGNGQIEMVDIGPDKKGNIVKTVITEKANSTTQSMYNQNDVLLTDMTITSAGTRQKNYKDGNLQSDIMFKPGSDSKFSNYLAFNDDGSKVQFNGSGELRKSKNDQYKVIFTNGSLTTIDSDGNKTSVIKLTGENRFKYYWTQKDDGTTVEMTGSGVIKAGGSLVLTMGTITQTKGDQTVTSQIAKDGTRTDTTTQNGQFVQSSTIDKGNTVLAFKNAKIDVQSPNGVGKYDPKTGQISLNAQGGGAIGSSDDGHQLRADARKMTTKQLNQALDNLNQPSIVSPENREKIERSLAMQKMIHNSRETSIYKEQLVFREKNLTIP